MKYGIRGVPTLILFQGGEKVGQHVGALNGAQLDAFVMLASCSIPSTTTY